MSILSILATNNFITVNRTVASIVGLEAAVIFGELAGESQYWSEKSPEADGWFFSTVENLEEKTFLSAHQQREALKRLEDQGWIETEKKGMPARRFIRLKEEKIIESLNDQSLKILTTSGQKTERPVVKNFNGNNNISNNNIKEDYSIKSIQPSLHNKTIIEDLLDSIPEITTPELKEAFLGFIEMRRTIKAPVTNRGLKIIAKETAKLGGNDPETMIRIIDQSISHNWKGVFPLKNQQETQAVAAKSELETIPAGNKVSKEELKQIITFLSGAIPYNKNINIEAATQAWIIALGDYPAEDILKAVRFHINTSKFFPTPDDIIRNMARAKLVYQDAEPETKALPAGQQDQDDDDDSIDDFINIE